MKISKYLHSCLLIEEQGKTVLLDPGNYSYESHALDISKLPSLDVIGITHEHQDHMYIPWIKEIIKRFPSTQIITTNSAVKILEKEGIMASAKGNEFVSLEYIPHEKIWFGPQAENIKIILFEKFATAGDSLTFDSSPEILALPITAPWGSTTWAVETALKVKPKVVIPIHDWHWKDEVRKGMHQRLHEYFKTQGIDFKTVETGEIIEI